MKYILSTRNIYKIELLTDFGLDFYVDKSLYSYTEKFNKLPMQEEAKMLAKDKALKCLARNKEILKDEDYCIIATEEIIALKTKFYWKPVTRLILGEYLKDFSGKTHSVITGVCLLVRENNQEKELLDFDYTHVTFRWLEKEDFYHYPKVYHTDKRVGGYNILHDPRNFVESYQRSLSNSYGMPLEKLGIMFRKLGLKKQRKSLTKSEIEKRLKNLDYDY